MSRRGAAVLVEDETGGRPFAKRRVLEVATRVLAVAGLAGPLAVRLVADEAMRTLNRAHLGRDRTTNVLSFPAEPAFPGDEPGLGDLVIAPWTVVRQAEQGGRDPHEELDRVVVHGVLHLVGYDHVGSVRERERMRAREREVLAALSVPPGRGM